MMSDFRLGPRVRRLTTTLAHINFAAVLSSAAVAAILDRSKHFGPRPPRRGVAKALVGERNLDRGGNGDHIQADLSDASTEGVVAYRGAKAEGRGWGAGRLLAWSLPRERA